MRTKRLQRELERAIAALDKVLAVDGLEHVWSVLEDANRARFFARQALTTLEVRAREQKWRVSAYRSVTLVHAAVVTYPGPVTRQQVLEDLNRDLTKDGIGYTVLRAKKLS